MRTVQSGASLHDATVVLDDRVILRAVSVAVGPGLTLVRGPNGSGKTTLLRALAGLIPLARGDRKVSGDVLYIGHRPMLLRGLTARENLEFFGHLYGLEHPVSRALELLEVIGLSDRASDPIKSYSRGMAQRVAIARALLHDPELLLADEPFDGLDAPSSESLEQLLGDLNLAGKTIVMVHHDIETTLKIAERAIVLRDGRIAIDEPTMRLYPKEVLSEVY